jgi:hypothetical protein
MRRSKKFMSFKSKSEILLKELSRIVEEDEEILTDKQKFIKVCLDQLGFNFYDEVIINIENPALGIKIDGYFFEEESDDLHIIVSHYEENELTFYELKEVLNNLVNQISKLFTYCLAPKKSKTKVISTSDLFELDSKINDTKENHNQIIVDIFINQLIDKNPFEGQIYSVNNIFIKRNFYDLDDLYETILANSNEDHVVNFRKYNIKSVPALLVDSNKDFDVYLFYLNGTTLANVYNDLKNKLLEGNVRSYLNKTQKVNSLVIQTVKNNPELFLPYNNGLSTVVSSIKNKNKKDNLVLLETLTNWQIVNGGQTTVSLYECFKENIDLKDIKVPVKMTHLKNKFNQSIMVGNISKYANTQTAIAKSDLISNEPYFVQLQNLSRTIVAYKDNVKSSANEYKWYFERTSGQYNTEKRIIYNYKKSFSKEFPEKLKFNKVLLAKSIMAWEQAPYSVALGKEKNIVTFNNLIKEKVVIANENYFKKIIASLILYFYTDKILKKKKAKFKQAILPYSISLYSFVFNKSLDYKYIWENQKLSEDIIKRLDNITNLVIDFFNNPVILEKSQGRTDMWARKDDAWDMLKAKIKASNNTLEETKLDLIPESEAEKYINAKNRYKDYKTWHSLLIWDDKNTILTKQEKKEISLLILDLKLSNGTALNEMRIKKAITAFINCAVGGYPLDGD